MFKYSKLDDLIPIIEQRKTLIVLKGYTIDKKIDLQYIFDNKIMYFFNTLNGNLVVSYDEYLAIRAFALEQFNQIIIVQNNMYHNLYPLYTEINDNVKECLVYHFTEDKELDDEIEIDLSDYINIYSMFIKYKDKYYVSYQISDTNEKERYIDGENYNQILDFPNYEFEKTESVFSITDDLSYIDLLELINNNFSNNLNIVIKNSIIPEKLLKEKFTNLYYYYQEKINFKIGQLSRETTSGEINPEYLEILNKYWGKKIFRKLKVYNQKALENDEKEIIEVLQGDIISDIVTQVEKCIEKKDFRDLFVTAPTGAGKSVMFQIPAIYLAEKYGLFTIVISPLIGLMKDQVNGLELRKYRYARTINSDISPIKKEEIIKEIEDHKCHILYLSPESLLSKADLDYIIGNRKLGLFVVDEAHIVTTWGKQFRPDYWYLGDYINKMRRSQLEKKQMDFIIATFTATAIYGGVENMYEETVQSLKLFDPITYLGYIKRDDISIKIENTKAIQNREEYEFDKCEYLEKQINRCLILNKKMLIYFPTVQLINRFYTHCKVKNLSKYVTIYHGQLDAITKDENYEMFFNNEKKIMLATKAFGMGIDIDNIEVVSHFAPTGTVCDYVQEIGRAARNPRLTGEVIYNFKSNDFKHINKLHGLSTVREYQLVEVIKKIYDLYKCERGRSIEGRKKVNQMLVDAECFTYIFDNGLSSEDDQINKVKTALLLIQKDFERRFGFSPFVVRPIPMFKEGYFEIDEKTQKKIIKRYGNIITVTDELRNICQVNLRVIWEKDFNQELSFPKFKYQLYNRDQILSPEYLNELIPALKIDIFFEKDYLITFNTMLNGIKSVFNEAIRSGKYYTVQELGEMLERKTKFSLRQCVLMMDMTIVVLKKYADEIFNCMNGILYKTNTSRDEITKYYFYNNVQKFTKWLERGFNYINNHVKDDTLYLVNNISTNTFKEYQLLLGLLEAYKILTFKSLGGKNSQIYIYVNQTQTLHNIVSNPSSYKNRLVEMVAERHYISVEMLTFLFTNNFKSDEIWEYLEDYFLGKIPKEVISAYEKRTNNTLTMID